MRMRCVGLLLFGSMMASGVIARAAQTLPSVQIHRESEVAAKRRHQLAGRLLTSESLRLVDFIDETDALVVRVPFGLRLNDAQLTYLLRQAVFVRNATPLLHLAPAQDFSVVLGYFGQVELQTYLGGPVLSARIGDQLYWAQIPDPAAFAALGNVADVSVAATRLQEPLHMLYEDQWLPDVAALRRLDPLSPGGAVVDVLDAGGKQIAVVRRSFGSGLPSCLLDVYIKTDRGWGKRLALGHYNDRSLDFSQEGDVLVIRNHESGAEQLRLSIRLLFERERIPVSDGMK